GSNDRLRRGEVQQCVPQHRLRGQSARVRHQLLMAHNKNQPGLLAGAKRDADETHSRMRAASAPALDDVGSRISPLRCRSPRTIAGALCSLGLHLALLVSIADAPRVELPPTSPEGELVAIGVLGTSPVSSTPREESSRAAPVAARFE